MKLKYRLVISFIIIIILPFAMYGFAFVDGLRTGQFLGIPEDASADQTRQAMMDVVISVLMILTLSSVILFTWTYRGVMRQLSILMSGAKDIKSGNLDHEIAMKGNDEIAEVGVAFEEMRKQLKSDKAERIEVERRAA